ncbi:MAG: TonB family protein [Porticoccaceae bacterium]|nr:TonB family protein [Porticoccaceae bacterium]
MLGKRLRKRLGKIVKHKLGKGFFSQGRAYLTGLTILGISTLSSGVNAELILNGSTIYSDLGKDQFVAALYTETAHNNPQVIQTMESDKRMEVRMLNNYSKRRWVNLWMQSISINNSRENFSDSAEELIALMQAPKSAPKKGDVLEYIFSPQQGTSMRFNGTELIPDLSGEVFGLLLRTWIGAIPPSTSFKEQILGNQRNREARNLLESLSPDKERVALAASWIAPPPKPQPTIKPQPKPAAVTAPEVIAAQPTLPPIAIEEPAPKTISEDKVAEVEKPSADEAKLVAVKEVTAMEAGAEGKGEKETTQELAATENTVAEQSAVDKDEEDIDFNIAEALAQRDYTPLVVQKIYQNISYPSRAVSKNQQGTVRVAVQIGRSGELQSILTTQASKYSSLNRAALKAVEKAAPFPELPEQISAEFFELSIPITFRLE